MELTASGGLQQLGPKTVQARDHETYLLFFLRIMMKVSTNSYACNTSSCCSLVSMGVDRHQLPQM